MDQVLCSVLHKNGPTTYNEHFIPYNIMTLVCAGWLHEVQWDLQWVLCTAFWSMDMTGVYACLFEAVCDVTTVPSHLKVVQLFQNCAETFRFQQAFKQKNRLKIALQVSKLASSPIVMNLVIGSKTSRDLRSVRTSYKPFWPCTHVRSPLQLTLRCRFHFLHFLFVWKISGELCYGLIYSQLYEWYTFFEQ